MKKLFFLLLIIVIIIGIIFGIKKENYENVKETNNIEETNIENQETIESNKNLIEEETDTTINNVVNVSIEELQDMKKEINSTGNTDIYQVEKEKDGRKILQIKPQIQFNVDLAGIIKKSKPEEKELENLLENIPSNNGIWISNQSRDLILMLLNRNSINNFYISEDGYLKRDGGIESDIEKELEKMINSKKLYIINITGIAYQRDYISGEIVEYPFEEMDPEQVLESYKYENKIILELSTNAKHKLTDKEILETIVKY